jgi:ribonuclease PH
VDRLRREGRLARPPLRDQVAAVSVGHCDNAFALDLCYAEDSSARVDLNVVATGRGGIVEIQGTAEGEAVPRADVDSMIDLALIGIQELVQVQQRVLEGAGVKLADIMH